MKLYDENSMTQIIIALVGILVFVAIFSLTGCFDNVMLPPSTQPVQVERASQYDVALQLPDADLSDLVAVAGNAIYVPNAEGTQIYKFRMDGSLVGSISVPFRKPFNGVRVRNQVLRIASDAGRLYMQTRAYTTEFRFNEWFYEVVDVNTKQVVSTLRWGDTEPFGEKPQLADYMIADGSLWTIDSDVYNVSENVGTNRIVALDPLTLHPTSLAVELDFDLYDAFKATNKPYQNTAWYCLNSQDSQMVSTGDILWMTCTGNGTGNNFTAFSMMTGNKLPNLDFVTDVRTTDASLSNNRIYALSVDYNVLCWQIITK